MLDFSDIPNHGQQSVPAPPAPDLFANGYSERFVDTTTGRTIARLRWDRQWTAVEAELRSGPLPVIRDLTLFERSGLATPSPDGEVVVRIDRSTLKPCFVVTLNGRRLMVATEDQLPPATQAELAKQGPPPRGSSTQALLGVVAAIVGGVILVTGGVILLTRNNKTSSSASQTSISVFPQTPLGTLPSAPYPSDTIPYAPPSTFASIADRLEYEARSFGSIDPAAAATCMQTEYPQISQPDVDGFTAVYRSAQYRCMPTEMTARWRVSATGLIDADKPCANLGSTIGMGKLTLEEMERVMPYTDTAQFPPDIQAKLVAAVKAECPQIPASVAERVITEKFPG
jgi:hypothetical protein